LSNDNWAFNLIAICVEAVSYVIFHTYWEFICKSRLGN
jgi:hypothetical protein